MIPEHISKGRKKWVVNVKKAIDDQCICKAKMAKKIGMSSVMLNLITSYSAYPSFKNFQKINTFLGLQDQRYFYYRKKRSDARNHAI